MKKQNFSQITEWCHQVVASVAEREGFYIDATMGNGHDTEFLCQLAGKRGHVLAFDVQQAALDTTRKRLNDAGFPEKARLVLDGHEHMDLYADPGTADVIFFNFGYLPGGDHALATKPQTSIPAIEKSLLILKSGGVLCLCIYSGGDTGFEEKDRILSYIRQLPSREYTVILNEYYNRINHPPVPVFVFKR